MNRKDDLEGAARAPEDSSDVEAALTRLASDAGQSLRDARSAIEPGDAELVRSALRRAVQSAPPAPRSAWRSSWRGGLALAAALAVTLLGFAWFRWTGLRGEPQPRRWLSGPEWVELVDTSEGVTALRLQRELPSGARYDLRVWAGDPAQLICSESTQAPQWNLPPAALSALEEHGSLEILVELVDDSGGTPSAPARFQLRSR